MLTKYVGALRNLARMLEKNGLSSDQRTHILTGLLFIYLFICLLLYLLIHLFIYLIIYLLIYLLFTY